MTTMAGVCKHSKSSHTPSTISASSSSNPPHSCTINTGTCGECTCAAKKPSSTCEECLKQLKTPDFYVMINLDAAANTGLTTVLVTVVNSKCFGSGQSRVATIPIAIWEGGEEAIKEIQEDLLVSILQCKKSYLLFKSFT